MESAAQRIDHRPSVTVWEPWARGVDERTFDLIVALSGCDPDVPDFTVILHEG